MLALPVAGRRPRGLLTLLTHLLGVLRSPCRGRAAGWWGHALLLLLLWGRSLNGGRRVLPSGTLLALRLIAYRRRLHCLRRHVGSRTLIRVSRG